MDSNSFFQNKLLTITSAFVITLLFILWEHFNGGVITHHFLAREDMPGISNWWGLLSIPLVTWIAVSLIQKRKSNGDNPSKFIINRFILALIFGAIASLLWVFDTADILQYYILLPILIAFFRPIYYPEYLLGFIFGMLFTFGGILPLILGLILVTICFIVNKITLALKKLFISN